MPKHAPACELLAVRPDADCLRAARRGDTGTHVRLGNRRTWAASKVRTRSSGSRTLRCACAQRRITCVAVGLGTAYSKRAKSCKIVEKRKGERMARPWHLMHLRLFRQMMQGHCGRVVGCGCGYYCGCVWHGLAGILLTSLPHSSLPTRHALSIMDGQCHGS